MFSCLFLYYDDGIRPIQLTLLHLTQYLTHLRMKIKWPIRMYIFMLASSRNGNN
jgi:hypothetical protein